MADELDIETQRRHIREMFRILELKQLETANTIDAAQQAELAALQARIDAEYQAEVATLTTKTDAEREACGYPVSCAPSEPAPREWVALFTMSENTDADDPTFWEAGGVYLTEPENSAQRAARELEPGEHVAACPRCGQRFAATAESPAEACRDLHFNGDEEIPSICAPGSATA